MKTLLQFSPQVVGLITPTLKEQKYSIRVRLLRPLFLACPLHYDPRECTALNESSSKLTTLQLLRIYTDDSTGLNHISIPPSILSLFADAIPAGQSFRYPILRVVTLPSCYTLRCTEDSHYFSHVWLLIP